MAIDRSPFRPVGCHDVEIVLNIWSFWGTAVTAATAVAAGLFAVCGALLLYAAAPHQQLVRRPLPRRRPLALSGAVALLLSLALFLQVAGRAAAVFILLTLAMLVWSGAPLAIAWRWRGDAA